MSALLSSSPTDAMTYLPDNPTRERPSYLDQPILFPMSRPTATPKSPTDWSTYAFWSTVTVLGSAAALLLAWGAYVGSPGGANAEKKFLQAQLAVPKLKGEAPAPEPQPPRPTLVASNDSPALPPPSAPTVTPVQPAKVELPPLPPISDPPPVTVPLKIDTPVMLTAPPAPVATQPVFPPPAVVKNELPPAPPAAPPLPKVETPPVVEPEQPASTFLARANLGETPMIRTWKTLTLYTLLAVAPVATPALAQQEDATKLQKQFEDLRKLLDTAVKSIDAAGKGIDSLKTDLGKLQEDVNALKTSKLAADVDLGKANTRVENVEKQLTNVQADVNFLKRELSKLALANGGATSTDKAMLDELKKHLISIEQAILKLRPAEPTTSRVALSPPAATGRVILTNMYHEEMLFVINQKTYRVAPGSVLPLESPAGTIEYEVLSPTWGQRARSRTTLPANETFTLTAR